MKKYVRRPPDALEDALIVAGGEVDEYKISLGFYGDELDPASVTALLGRPATSHCVKGDVVHKNGSTRTERTGKWILSLVPSPGESLEPHLEQLLASLSPDLSVWKQLGDHFKSRFVVSAWIRTWNRGLEIPSALLRKIADRKLNLGIDIYVDYEEGSSH